LPPASKRRKKTGRKCPTEKALLGYMKQHLSNDFPNPTRIGCPPLEALEHNAKDPIHADESVSKHVAHCSPCYRVYSRLLREDLARIRQQAPAHNSSRGTHKKTKKVMK
jgi:hypothetical protein